MPLPFDISRCLAEPECQHRGACARYVDRGILGPATPVHARRCELGKEAEGFIHVRAIYEETTRAA